MKNLLVCIAAMAFMLIVAPQEVAGQQVADNTSARVFVMPNPPLSSVTLWQSPSTKSEKVGQLLADFSLPVVERRDDWYQVVNTDGKKVWIQAVLCKTSMQKLDITDATDHMFGVSESYDEYCGWSVAQVKGTDMYVAYTISENSTMIPWGERLWLGKKERNTLVFDRYVRANQRWMGEEYTSFSVSKALENGALFYTFSYGDNHAMPETSNLCPSVFTLKMINQLFDGTEYTDMFLYIGPDMLSDKYKDVVWG